MASIKVELEKIAGLANGQDVLDAIASASEKINQNEFDITEELEIIRSRANRYGIDIRMAIHDALEKLQRKAEGQGKGPSYSSNVQASPEGIILPTKFAICNVPPFPFMCDDEWLIHSSISWYMGGRGYQKSDSQPAIGMCVVINHEGSLYTTALFISPISSAVAYSSNPSPEGTVTYDDLLWYYSTTNWAIDGVCDVSGLPMYQPSVTAPITHPYTSEGIISVLDAVNAKKVEV